jgi:uncharacterized membrane protein
MTQQVLAGIRFAPVLPWWAIGALAAVCLAVLALGAWRRAPGIVWRALAFGVVLAWLCGPRMVQETRRPLPDIGLLVIDQSASMTVADRTTLAGRAGKKLEADGRRIAGLELRTATVPEAGQDGTALFAAIDRAAAAIPQAQLAGVVAVTDGQVHDVPSAWRYAVPLHVLVTGRAGETDRRLRLIEAPEFGLVGKSVTFRIAVDDLGAGHPDQAATLTIRRDGETPRQQSVPVGEPHDIDIPVTREGPSVVEFSVSPLPGEISTLNNRVAVTVNGVRDRLRVLLISGEPHIGERTWRRLLKSDPAVDLVHFTILRPPEKDDLTPLNELALIAFPTRELFQEKIGEFDLIILDRFQNRGILPPQYLRNIADYVRRGGALLMSVGPEFAGAASLDDTPLRDILPAHPRRGDDGEPDSDGVVDGAFRPAVTALGERHPVTASLPGWQDGAPPQWGSWYRRIAVEPGPHGEALLSAGSDDAPLLLLDRVEKGRVALLLSDQIWLWSRGHQGGGPQAELLRRVAHWLMHQPELEEDALTAVVAPAAPGPELLIGRTSLGSGAPPPVTVTDPDGARRTLPLRADGPGRARAALPAPTPGVWQVSDGQRTVFAAAGMSNPKEVADLRATTATLAPLAQATGGSIRFLAGPGTRGDAPTLLRTSPGSATSGESWIGLPARGAHIVTALDSVPLLPGWAALLLLGGLVVTAWWREGA